MGPGSCFALPGRRNASQHPQRLHIGFQDGFLFGALIGVLLAQADDGAQRLDVEAVALGLRIDVADIIRDRLLFFFQPLDALDDGLELVFGKFCRGRFLDGGSSGGHRVLLNELMVEEERRTLRRGQHPEMTLKSGATRVKATSCSSTARPQEKTSPHGEERAKRASRTMSHLILRDAALRAAPQDEENNGKGGTLNVRYGSFSSPRAARDWPYPDRSTSRSRRACRRRPRGSRPCSCQ